MLKKPLRKFLSLDSRELLVYAMSIEAASVVLFYAIIILLNL